MICRSYIYINETKINHKENQTQRIHLLLNYSLILCIMSKYFRNCLRTSKVPLQFLSTKYIRKASHIITRYQAEYFQIVKKEFKKADENAELLPFFQTFARAFRQKYNI